MDIENMSPKSGRALKENNTVVNVAELIESINTKIDTLDAVMDDIKTAVEGTLTTTLTGSKVCLSTESKPAGIQGDTLLEYNPTTLEAEVYKFISGDWRKL